MNRRRFLGTLAVAPLMRPRHCAAGPFPVRFRRASPYEALTSYIQPGSDEFPEEKAALEIVSALRRLAETRICPAGSPEARICQWLATLGEIRAARFYPLSGGRVRYEVQSMRTSGNAAQLEYRVGQWRQRWLDGKLIEHEPLGGTLAVSPRPLFRDVTAELFGADRTFHEQMLRGVPYWRACLDPASGIDVYGSNGIAVGDCDGDGRDEVYICQPGGLPNRLYKLREGRMEDITAKAGVGILDDTSCALFLDLRNSGHQDLVVLRSGGPVLFLNRGDGTFSLQPDAFRFRAAPQGSFTGMSAADYDRDGRLDLYLCAYSYFQSEDQYRYPVPYYDAQNGPPNFLFRNQLAADGSGIFEDVTEAAGLNHNNNRFSFAPAWCDYDGDGWPDLYVANDFGRNNLYKNTEGRFQDVARQAGVEDIGPGMSAAWFDYNNDGLPDLYVANMWTDAGQRVVERLGGAGGLPEHWRSHTKGNSLYKNRGDGSFFDAGAAEGLEMGRWAWSADAHDFDNDGSPEIYIACGMLTGPAETDLSSFFWRQVVAKTPSTAERSEAYENGWNAINQFIREDYSWNGREPNVFYARRNGSYTDCSGISGLDCALDSRAFAVTDLDGDGNLDLLVKNRLAPQVSAFRNESTGGRKALAIRLTGARSNRDAIGARVEVDGTAKYLQAGSGYLSQHTKVLHFGLGNANEAKKVSILWPSGLRQEFQRLAAGYRYSIAEGSPEITRQPFAPVPFSPPSAALVSDNQPGTRDTWLIDPVPLPDKRNGPGLLYVGAGERPIISKNIEVVDLRNEPPDVAASYALFRRYLLDWRTKLVLPLVLLIDGMHRAHKLYAAAPDAATLDADLARLREPDRQRIALPFAGDYTGRPRRNYFKLGAAFYWAGYPEQALGYLEEVLREMPKNDKALNAIGQIHLDSGRADKARTYLERAIAANSRLGEAWNNLGGVESATGNWQVALKNYERAIELLPKAVYPLVNAGEVSARLGDAAAAKKRFQDAITLKPDHAGAINNLGVLYGQLGQTGDAIAAFEYGIRVAPFDELLYLNLGRVYIAAGERDKARAVMLRLLDRKPGSEVARNALRELEIR